MSAAWLEGEISEVERARRAATMLRNHSRKSSEENERVILMSPEAAEGLAQLLEYLADLLEGER